MDLRTALRITPGQVVALVGAGGKSGAIRRLVGELAVRDAPPLAAQPDAAGRWDPQPPAMSMAALVTTTTRLGRQQYDLAARHLIDPGLDQLSEIPQLLDGHTSLLVTGPEEAGKWTPPSAAVLAELAEMTQRLSAVLLIEADGARGRALKAPADHEPVIPKFTDLVVLVAGMEALGRPVSSEAVHRPELVAGLLGLQPSDRIEIEHMARLLASPMAGLKRVPPRAEVRALLTQLAADRVEAARRVGAQLLAAAPPEQLRAVALADLRADDPVAEVHGRVAGIVLAAGGSSRLGQAKQLIEWRGRPLVAYAVSAALQGGLDPVIVVLGDHPQQVRQALAGQPVEFVHNPDWASGQSSSVRAGLGTVRDCSEAAAFLLSDTPFVDGALVEALLERQRRTLAPLIAPWAAGRRANPVLFDRAVYPQLLDLEGDVGGRALFERFQVEWLEWDDSIALDLDTPQDLKRLRELE